MAVFRFVFSTQVALFRTRIRIVFSHPSTEQIKPTLAKRDASA